MVCIYLQNINYLLHKVQLNVSALDNDHLQVAHEVFIKQLYKTFMGCVHGADRRGGGHVISDVS